MSLWGFCTFLLDFLWGVCIIQVMEPFKRKIWDKFKAWKEESDGSTALLVEGARRIRKPTAVEDFPVDNVTIFER